MPEKNDSQEKLKAIDEVLLREYEKVIELSMSEGKIAWELISIYWVTQIGLVSALAILTKELSPREIINYWLLFIVGSVSSFAWVFIQYRNKMWRENWLSAGLWMARQMRQRGIMLNDFEIFEIERHVREKNETLKLSNNEIGWRKQRCWEKTGALKLAHIGMAIAGVLWLLVLVYFFFLAGVFCARA